MQIRQVDANALIGHGGEPQPIRKHKRVQKEHIRALRGHKGT